MKRIKSNVEHHLIAEWVLEHEGKYYLIKKEPGLMYGNYNVYVFHCDREGKKEGDAIWRCWNLNTTAEGYLERALLGS